MNRFALVPLAAAAAVSISCGRGQKASLPETGPVARSVRVVRPAARIETGLTRATGTVRAREDAVLSAKATGQIRRIRVNVGDRVRAGATIVEMDATNAGIGRDTASATERLAAARLAEAEREVARARVLFDAQSLPQAALEQAQAGRDMAAAQHDQARAALRMAEQQVADSTITAPFGGVITARFRNAGDTVTLMPVSPIVALTDVDHLEVRLTIPEAIEPYVSVGQTVEGVTTPGGKKFQAKVRVKSAVVDPATRTVEVLADVVKSEGVRPGTLVTADFGHFGDAGGMFLPATAVETDGKASWVFVVASGKAERRDVTVERVHPGTVSVKHGLAPDAQVVVEPGTLAAGETVVPLAD
jgi:RND family efflux transporter MFP subunit